MGIDDSHRSTENAENGALSAPPMVHISQPMSDSRFNADFDAARSAAGSPGIGQFGNLELVGAMADASQGRPKTWSELGSQVQEDTEKAARLHTETNQVAKDFVTNMKDGLAQPQQVPHTQEQAMLLLQLGEKTDAFLKNHQKIEDALHTAKELENYKQELGGLKKKAEEFKGNPSDQRMKEIGETMDRIVEKFKKERV